MRRRKLVWFVLGCLAVTAAIGATLWQSINDQCDAPELPSAYDDLTQFWGEVAQSLQINPEEAYLQQWNVAYDLHGEILHQAFKIYVDKGIGTHDVYYYSQDQHRNRDARQSASWSRQRLDGSAPEGLVQAQIAFAAVNRLGFRELEQNQDLRPPARFWFFAESGSKTYQPLGGGYLVQGDQITSIGPEGVTVHGPHGTFGFAKGASTTTTGSVTTPSRENPGPPIFVVPLGMR